MTQIKECGLVPINIKPIVGMTNYDRLIIDAHQGLKQSHYTRSDPRYLRL